MSSSAFQRKLGERANHYIGWRSCRRNLTTCPQQSRLQLSFQMWRAWNRPATPIGQSARVWIGNDQIVVRSGGAGDVVGAPSLPRKRNGHERAIDAGGSQVKASLSAPWALPLLGALIAVGTASIWWAVLRHTW